MPVTRVESCPGADVTTELALSSNPDQALLNGDGSNANENLAKLHPCRSAGQDETSRECRMPAGNAAASLDDFRCDPV